MTTETPPNIPLCDAEVVERFDQGVFRFVTLDAPEIAALARPGQFLQLLPPADPEEFFLPRPMSILHAGRATGRVQFAFKEVGRGTRRLARATSGDRLRTLGPLGAAWETPDRRLSLVLVAGGVGFPPLYFQAWREIQSGRVPSSIVFILGAQSGSELAFADELHTLGVDLRIATDDGSRGTRGTAVDLLRAVVAGADPRALLVQACGPMPMLAALARLAAERGLEAQVSLESPMACGVGACMGCALPSAGAPKAPRGLTMLCDEGTIYSAADLDWKALAPSAPPRATPLSPEQPLDLSVRFAGIEMASPVVVASGTFGYGGEYARIVDLERLGAVITKSVSEQPRPGNPPPRIRELPTGMLNAIGLQNVGIERFIADKLPFFDEIGTRLIVNIVGHDEEEYFRLLDRLAGHPRIDGIELNLSCPNVAGGMRLASDPDTIRAFVARARDRCPFPLIVKLTPNVTDIAAVAQAAEEGGADALSLINTLVGMAIDLDTRRPWIARGTAGYSGPGVKPVALAMTWTVSQAVSIPILGGGGICTAADACEFIVAGASAISVGTMNFVDPEAPLAIGDGIAAWLRAQGCATVESAVGTLRPW